MMGFGDHWGLTHGELTLKALDEEERRKRVISRLKIIFLLLGIAALTKYLVLA